MVEKPGWESTFQTSRWSGIQYWNQTVPTTGTRIYISPRRDKKASYIDLTEAHCEAERSVASQSTPGIYLSAVFE